MKMIKQYDIQLSNGSVHPLTFHGESDGDCNAQAVAWCMKMIGEPEKDWCIVKDTVLSDTTLEHFWGLDKIN